MGRNTPVSQLMGRKPGYCIGCMARFVGPGDRCPKCAQVLRERHRQHLAAKRRRRR
jgi:hypothetical protein